MVAIVLYFQTNDNLPKWMSRVRVPSPAPCFQQIAAFIADSDLDENGVTACKLLKTARRMPAGIRPLEEGSSHLNPEPLDSSAIGRGCQSQLGQQAHTRVTLITIT
jgi:hypothetical protein